MVKMWEEIHEQPIVLERCIKNNSGVIKSIVDILRARNIGFVCMAARGTSDHAAVYGKYVIELTAGVPVALAASSVVTMYHRSLKLQNTLVIAVSQSGKAADALEFVKESNRQGAVTVSITNAPDSPLAQESMFHLCCEAGPELSVAATKTFTAQMMLLAMLAAEWSGDESLKRELAAVPERIPRIFDLSSVIEDNIARYRFMNECFVLARGVNFAVSLEAALKIQETTYVRAKAFATSDFQHGPIAMIDRDIPIIIFAPSGPSMEDVGDIIRKLKEKDMELLIVSNRKDVLALGTCALEIPEVENDILSPFFNVVAAQMFACRLSLMKGLDPDKPRMLNKVTITR